MQDIRDTTTIQAYAAQTIAAQSAVILPVQMEQVRWLGEEPALSDMLADPITQMLMHRDGVQEAEIRRLAARLRDRSSQRGARAAGRRAANDLATGAAC
jgi:hypothetical protein